eukprot:scaffold79434_cov32-Tisochrysis_lutea.AAC.2
MRACNQRVQQQRMIAGVNNNTFSTKSASPLASRSFEVLIVCGRRDENSSSRSWTRLVLLERHNPTTQHSR